MLEITRCNGTTAGFFAAFDAEINADSDYPSILCVLNEDAESVAT
jgi:hypothetical protein